MKMPGRSGPKPRRECVGNKELNRRLGNAIERMHAAAVAAIGEDVGPRRLRESLTWLFGYLLGGEQAHLIYTYASGSPTQVELFASRAIAGGIHAYASCLRSEGPPQDAWIADRLEALAARTGGFGPKGCGHLELVRDPEQMPQPEIPEDEAIPF